MLYLSPAHSWLLSLSSCVQEFRSAAHDFNLGISERLVVADDRILQCALSCQQLLQQLQRQQELSALGCGVLLLTNDMAFRLKVCTLSSCTLRSQCLGTLCCSADLASHGCFCACTSLPRVGR